MSSDNHMTDICEMIVNTRNAHKRMFNQTAMEDGLEAKLWATCFNRANPHMFLGPWDFYRQLPQVISDFVAMWSDKKVDVPLRNEFPYANPQPEDIMGLILAGRDQVPELFSDSSMEARLFSYCLNVTRPHSAAHGRTMHHGMGQFLQEFVEAWKFIEEVPQQLPPGLSEGGEKLSGEGRPIITGPGMKIEPVSTYGKRRK